MTTGLKQPSNSYLQLIASFPPRPIANEAEYRATQAQINKILERPNLTKGDRAYLNILGLTIYDYEEQQEKLPVLTGANLINALLEESNLTIEDLVPVLGSETLAREILNGERTVTPDCALKLSLFFIISGERFLQ
ncbi:MAG: transcriptional regulator [Oscillatoria sp. SIO1A7]|nr:transcriptional regulator [Oscillatoria sp. SIO1A7]